MFRHRADEGDEEVDELVSESEDVLRGSYAERLLQARSPIPPWAWLNLLAHGTLNQLRALARQPAPQWVWPRARWFLVGEVLDVVDSGASSLRTLQREVLVPLELCTSGVADGWGPVELVRTTLGAVHAQLVRAR